MSVTGAPVLDRQCAQCLTEVAPALLACPSCHTLIHAGRLKELSARAELAVSQQRPDEAITAWEEALTLLPEASRQHAAIRDRLTPLARERAAAPDTAASQPPAGVRSRKGTWWGAAVLAGGLLWKFKFLLAFVLTKGKLLLLGLTKGSTLFSMLASVGVYWIAFGLWFAVGLIGSIYVHEMGHVAALRRYGVPATAPMFIPGLGAFIRLKQMPQTVAEEARVGLAGPLWGFFAALAAAGAYLVTGNALWAAIAHVGAWLNIFNLTPIWQLDGSRGFVALSRLQRWTLTMVVASLWYVTEEGLLGLVLLVALGRTLIETPPEKPDRGVLALFVFLLAGLAVLSVLTPDFAAGR